MRTEEERQAWEEMLSKSVKITNMVVNGGPSKWNANGGSVSELLNSKGWKIWNRNYPPETTEFRDEDGRVLGSDEVFEDGARVTIHRVFKD